MLEAVIIAGLIFIARVVDVSLGTLRMLMLVKGRRMPASIIGFFEVIIFVVALSRVVGSLHRMEFLLMYALGFAVGNYVGIALEEKLALGHVGVQIILQGESDGVVQSLRQQGFGVTVQEGWGREGLKDVLVTVLPRRQLPAMMQIVNAHDERAFTIVMDARKALGGYHQRQKSK